MSKISRKRIANIIDPPMFKRTNSDSYADRADYRPRKNMIGWKVVFIRRISLSTDSPIDDEIGLSYADKFVPILAKLRISAKTCRTKYNDPLKEKYGKHRCSRAEVIGYYSYYTGRKIKVPTERIESCNNSLFSYPHKLPADVIPNRYDPTTHICSSGIHFFYEKQSALIWGDIVCAHNGLVLRKNPVSIYDCYY